ncbi:MAG: hypothetical protein FJ267_12330, partial [Planctomycetes bacterium]|nr:hypothetical protein [Planctomycetota bacterium]
MKRRVAFFFDIACRLWLLLVTPVLAWSQDRNSVPFPDEPPGIRTQLADRQVDQPLSQDSTSLDKGQSINPAVMDAVQDNTMGIRYEERDAYFEILALAQEIPLSHQQQFADEFRELRRSEFPSYARRKPSEFPTFVDLFQFPEEYRGRPVTLHGVLRKLTKFNPGKNSYGIQEAYEGWIYTGDSQSHPTAVVFLNKPYDLSVGGDLTEEVRVTGYFFKMYGYDANDVPRKAPLILAGEIEWRRGQGRYIARSLPFELYLIVGFVAFVVGYAIWQSNRKEVLVGSRRDEPEVDFSQFPPIEYTSRPLSP